MFFLRNRDTIILCLFLIIAHIPFAFLNAQILHFRYRLYIYLCFMYNYNIYIVIIHCANMIYNLSFVISIKYLYIFFAFITILHKAKARYSIGKGRRNFSPLIFKYLYTNFCIKKHPQILLCEC